jgi:hypothetical protein
MPGCHACHPMPVTSRDKLNNFYEALTSGLTVKSFLCRLTDIYEFIHSRGLTNDYRLGKRRMKKLRDEVTPVARFVKTYAHLEDRVQLTMDNKFPDCVLFRKDGGKLDIEVTRAQAREDYYLMTELNETGTGRGFIGVPDDAPTHKFEEAMRRERQASATDEIVSCIEGAIELRARKKKQHQADILLIEAPLWLLPTSRWYEYLARFTAKVKPLKFHEVYLTGRGDNDDICLKIK